MSGGATARLFVAVDPPAPVREQLAAWGRGVASAAGRRASGRGGRPLRLVDPQALHLTLCFLGSRPVEEIEAIGAALGDIPAHVGRLSVGAPQWLPPRRPRALAVEIHDSGDALERLHRAVAGSISRTVDWQPERRRFRAHITIARMSPAAGRDRGSPDARSELPATPQLDFAPEAIVLYRSRLAPAGATYEALATCGLTAPAPGSPLA
jgi:RNA 2',3'-cyclic 3'-phosphodiesterase